MWNIGHFHCFIRFKVLNFLSQVSSFTFQSLNHQWIHDCFVCLCRSTKQHNTSRDNISIAFKWKDKKKANRWRYNSYGMCVSVWGAQNVLIWCSQRWDLKSDANECVAFNSNQNRHIYIFKEPRSFHLGQYFWSVASNSTKLPPSSSH